MLITRWNEASRALPVLTLKYNYLDRWPNDCVHSFLVLVLQGLRKQLYAIQITIAYVVVYTHTHTQTHMQTHMQTHEQTHKHTCAHTNTYLTISLQYCHMRERSLYPEIPPLSNDTSQSQSGPSPASQ